MCNPLSALPIINLTKSNKVRFVLFTILLGAVCKVESIWIKSHYLGVNLENLGLPLGSHLSDLKNSLKLFIRFIFEFSELFKGFRFVSHKIQVPKS